MLPEVVWNMPKHGTFNLHASLLAKIQRCSTYQLGHYQWRYISGVTTFFIEHQIDTGNIIFQEKVSIETDDDAGILHDKLMKIGSQIVCKTIDAIAEDTAPNIKQEGTATKAPKIYKDTCQIDWYKDLQQYTKSYPWPIALSWCLDYLK